MLPSSHSQNPYDYPVPPTGSLYSGSNHGPMPFSMSAGMPIIGPLQQPADPSTPELFNGNIKIALEFIEDISRLARSALDGMYGNAL